MTVQDQNGWSACARDGSTNVPSTVPLIYILVMHGTTCYGFHRPSVSTFKTYESFQHEHFRMI